MGADNLSWSKIQRFAENWDKWDSHKIQLDKKRADTSFEIEEYFQLPKERDRHVKMLDEVKFLAESLFYSYKRESMLSPEKRLYKWLDNFNDLEDFSPQCSIKDLYSHKDERRFVFYLARKIIFFTEGQIVELMEVISNKLKLKFLKDLMDEGKIRPYDIFGFSKYVGQIMNESLFTQLSSDANGDEFRRLFLPPAIGGKKCYIDFLELISSYIRNNEDKNIRGYISKKKYLIVLDDFSGSGTKFSGQIKEIIKSKYFETIIFCPYIITNRSFKELKEIEKIATEKNKHFKIFWGMRISDKYSLNSDSNYWGEDREPLIRISEKYFDEYFNKRRSLKDEKTRENTPLGWKNGGYPLVIYNNCPNNSLPIIWCYDSDNEFKPLFLRIPKYGDDDGT